jgi:type I restriction enzyme M protein
MEEIEKNEYNLNISRYVSTSVDEELIDLQHVNQKLIQLNTQIETARNTHNEFLRELGVEGV